MRFILPRYIMGNRGDLASRWGVLQSLYDLGQRDVTVFRRADEDVPALPFQYINYGGFRNLIHGAEARKTMRKGDTVLWAVGLDLQDDSSIAKLLYLWLTFKQFQMKGLRTWSLFQGAGPLTTSLGRMISRQVLGQLDVIAARDPGTLDIVKRIRPELRTILAHDAIFLPGFESAAASVNASEKLWLDRLFGTDGRPVVGLNIRQWFHFSSSLLPYQFARRRYLKRSEEQMQHMCNAAHELVECMRRDLAARVILVSAYQPGIVPWEDDLPWLQRIKERSAGDAEVVLVDDDLSLPAYYAMMSRLSVMIGMRLHSTLIALRYGVPSINISYTLKGGAILSHLGLPDNALALPSFLDSPTMVYERAAALLADLPAQRLKTQTAVLRAVEINRNMLAVLLSAGDGK